MANIPPPEKLESLKKIIHEHLQAQNIYEQIRQFLYTYTQDVTSTGVLTEEKIIKALQEKGVIDDIVKSIQRAPSPPSSPVPQLPPQSAPPPPIVDIIPGKRYLYLKVLGGRAFVEYINAVDQADLSEIYTKTEFYSESLHVRTEEKRP